MVSASRDVQSPKGRQNTAKLSIDLKSIAESAGKGFLDVAAVPSSDCECSVFPTQICFPGAAALFPPFRFVQRTAKLCIPGMAAVDPVLMVP